MGRAAPQAAGRGESHGLLHGELVKRFSSFKIAFQSVMQEQTEQVMRERLRRCYFKENSKRHWRKKAVVLLKEELPEQKRRKNSCKNELEENSPA